MKGVGIGRVAHDNHFAACFTKIAQRAVANVRISQKLSQVFDRISFVFTTAHAQVRQIFIRPDTLGWLPLPIAGAAQNGPLTPRTTRIQLSVAARCTASPPVSLDFSDKLQPAINSTARRPVARPTETADAQCLAVMFISRI